MDGASYLQAFEADRLQVLARLNIAATFDDYYVGLPFFGLAATVCAWLWLKSGYIPKGVADRRRRVVGMVRDLRVCLSHFSRIRQAG